MTILASFFAALLFTCSAQPVRSAGAPLLRTAGKNRLESLNVVSLLHFSLLTAWQSSREAARGNGSCNCGLAVRSAVAAARPDLMVTREEWGAVKERIRALPDGHVPYMFCDEFICECRTDNHDQRQDSAIQQHSPHWRHFPANLRSTAPHLGPRPRFAPFYLWP